MLCILVLMRQVGMVLVVLFSRGRFGILFQKVLWKLLFMWCLLGRSLVFDIVCVVFVVDVMVLSGFCFVVSVYCMVWMWLFQSLGIVYVLLLLRIWLCVGSVFVGVMLMMWFFVRCRLIGLLLSRNLCLGLVICMVCIMLMLLLCLVIVVFFCVCFECVVFFWLGQGCGMVFWC